MFTQTAGQTGCDWRGVQSNSQAGLAVYRVHAVPAADRARAAGSGLQNLRAENREAQLLGTRPQHSMSGIRNCILCLLTCRRVAELRRNRGECRVLRIRKGSVFDKWIRKKYEYQGF